MLQTQPLTFLLVFSYLDPRLWPSQSCSFGFLSSDTSICSTMASPPLRNSDHVAVLISINFPSNSQWNALFYLIAYDYSCADWDSLPDHLREVPWEDIFKLSASAAASDLCEWVQVDIDIYIPHRKYQVKFHSSPWFSAAYAAAIVHSDHFFICTNRVNLLNLKQSSDRLVTIVKGFLKLLNLDMLIKQKSPPLPRNFALGMFGELPIPFSTKVNLLHLLYSTDQRCCLLHLIKQNCFLKTFLRTLILMTQVSLDLFSFLELI